MYGYGYGYPYPAYPVYGYQANGGNDGFGTGWWAIIIVIFVIFFLFWGAGSSRGKGVC